MNNNICLTSYWLLFHAEHNGLHSDAFMIVARWPRPNTGYVEQLCECKLKQLREGAWRLFCNISSQKRKRDTSASTEIHKCHVEKIYMKHKHKLAHCGTLVNRLAGHRLLRFPAVGSLVDRIETGTISGECDWVSTNKHNDCCSPALLCF